MDEIRMLLLKMEPEIGDIQMSAEKADIMANDIAEEYFDTDISDVNGKARICYYFDSTRVRHDILFDYIKNISQQTEKLNSIWNKIYDLTRKSMIIRPRN